MKLAVILPGIGYHKDKPLLYYATKMVKNIGYDVIDISYHEMPQKIKGNAEMLAKAAGIAFDDAEKQLKDIDFSVFEDVIFIGKSIGTFTVAKYIHDHNICARQIWYTPVEATFGFDSKDVIAFIGDADPWSDVDNIKQMSKEQGISLFSYPDCNHSLECGNVDIDLKNLKEVMRLTEDYINNR